MRSWQPKKIKMKKYVLLLALWLTTHFVHAQTIDKVEYFFDTDPGIGNGLNIPVSGNNPLMFSVSNLSVNSLSNGFHLLCVRARGTDGIWGMYESRAVFISTSTTDAANINAAEFFIDTDPGIGLGTAILPSPNGSTVIFTTSISTNSLSAGFHNLSIRVKDADGKWGLYETRAFYVSASSTDVANIVAAEFFVDADPGVGLGTAITPNPNGATVNFTALVPTTSLAQGFHNVSIRTKDADGKWGLYETRAFYISNSSADATNIVAAEFFVDADPGAGLGTSILPSPNGSTVNFTASIPTTSLANGFHNVSIRTKDADGKWGLYESRVFYISTATNDMPVVQAAEFFIDVDPGVGNGTALTVNAPGNTVNQTFVCATPNGLTDNVDHFLFMRVKDLAGNWGLYAFDTFRVDIGLPVTGLQVQAKRKGKAAQVDWQTLTESNSSHFELERSRNGIAFTAIANIAAAGNSTIKKEYTYLDMKASEGINYYRIKQVDSDGKFVYSAIVKLLLFNEATNLIVYPNPAKDWVQMEFASARNVVLVNVVDALGRIVQTKVLPTSSNLKLDVSSLTNGLYYLQLSDGEKIATAKFVKQ
jgi:Secretion system C-terminal sorting domain